MIKIRILLSPWQSGSTTLEMARREGSQWVTNHRMEMECIVDPAEPVKLEILVFARARNVLRVFCDSFSGRWPS